MDSHNNPASMPTPELSAKQSQRNDQAREIMQQLIAEGFFTKDEAAEIVFSDATVVCVPDKDKTEN